MNLTMQEVWDEITKDEPYYRYKSAAEIWKLINTDNVTHDHYVMDINDTHLLHRTHPCVFPDMMEEEVTLCKKILQCMYWLFKLFT